MNRLTVLVLGSLTLGIPAVLAPACGGVAGDGLFAGSGGGPAGTASTGGAGTTAATSASSSTTAVTTTSASTSTAASSGSTSSTSAASSAASTSSSVSSTAASSSSGTTVPPLDCNGGPCTAGEICCYYPDPPPAQPPAPDHCGHAGQCGTGFTEVSCAGPADCPNQYCCAQFTLGGNPPAQYRRYTGIACQAACSDQDEIVVCDPASTNPCPYGGTCTQSTLLGPGYSICN